MPLPPARAGRWFRLCHRPSIPEKKFFLNIKENSPIVRSNKYRTSPSRRSARMSLPATLPQPILETILTRLLALFLKAAGGDQDAARQAARQMLAAYHPETEAELHLA